MTVKHRAAYFNGIIMLSAYVFRMVAKPKQILLGEYRATVIVFILAGMGMMLTLSPVFAGIVVGILHPVNIWLTRVDPFYVDIFWQAWRPLLLKFIHKSKKETIDA
jgi:uncharacterized membrane protein YjgN (DUF898 family)